MRGNFSERLIFYNNTTPPHPAPAVQGYFRAYADQDGYGSAHSHYSATICNLVRLNRKTDFIMSNDNSK